MKQILGLVLLLSLTFPAICQVSGPLNLKIKQGTGGLSITDNDDKKLHFSWFPAKNADQAAAIWSNGERWKFLNMAAISGTTSGGSATVGIVNDYLGPLRLALFGNVSATDSDSLEQKKIERFISGGGSAAVVGNLLGPTLTWSKASYVLTSFVPKFGFDFPALGTSTSKSTANADLGVELKIHVPLANDNMGLFGNVRSSVTFGGDEFLKQIGITKGSYFGYTLLNAGITLPKMKLALLFTSVLDGPGNFSQYNGNGRISLVVSP